MPAAPSPYAGPRHAYHPHPLGRVGCEGVRACGNPHLYQHHLNCSIPDDGGGTRLTTCGESVTSQTLGEKSGRPTIRTTIGYRYRIGYRHRVPV